MSRKYLRRLGPVAGVILLAALGAWGCADSDQLGPGEVARAYTQALIAGDIDGAVSYVHSESVPPEGPGFLRQSLDFASSIMRDALTHSEHEIRIVGLDLQGDEGSVDLLLVVPGRQDSEISLPVAREADGWKVRVD